MKATPFLVTGMPRSMTAWLSVFLTTGTSLCYHEPTWKISDIKQLRSLYESQFYKFVGIADHALGFFLPEILQSLRPRTVVVWRDPKEVQDSLAKIGLPRTNFVDLLAEAIAPFHNHPLVLWVPFEALNEKRTAQKIFWHLMPGEPFDEPRYEELSKMMIETNPIKTIIAAERHQQNLNSLLKDVLPRVRMLEGNAAKPVKRAGAALR